MLVDVHLQPDPITEMLAQMNGQKSNLADRLQSGVYQLSAFNFDNMIPVRLTFDEKYPKFSCGLGSFGVCDELDQLLKRCPELTESTTRAFAIGITKVSRENQSPEGGWRWHKWGEYIGTQNPEHEYLYDDTHIDHVYVYEIVELTNHAQDLLAKEIGDRKPVSNQKRIS